MSNDCPKNVSENHKKMSLDPFKNISENQTKWSNSTVIENSGNSKNRINFRSLSKSTTEASVKAAADQDQDQNINF